MTSNVSQLQLKQEITALKSENRKLHTKLVKMQTENFSLKSELGATKKELKKLQSKHNPSVDISELMGSASDLLNKIKKP